MTNLIKNMRKPRVLWANAHCLLDISSGASISALEMLHQLSRSGIDIRILGAAVFDHSRGIYGISKHEGIFKNNLGKIVQVNDGLLIHKIFSTKSVIRVEMTSAEEARWLAYYRRELEEFKPDIVMYYGGLTLDHLISVEAKRLGIPSVAYLVNGNYSGSSWCADVDLIITDTHATAEFYLANHAIPVTPVGTFIGANGLKLQSQERKNLLFVNPELSKGATIVAQTAFLLERQRPDIKIEIVETRGDWKSAAKLILEEHQESRDSFNNVTVTPATDDMRPIYSRARILFAPSLWWESGARVLAEAMLNGIPAIVTKNGGSPEMIGEGGIRVILSQAAYRPPFNKIPSISIIQPLVDQIIKMYDDEAYYNSLVEKAYAAGSEIHNIEKNTKKLIDTLMPLLKKQAGDLDFWTVKKFTHQHMVSPRFPQDRWGEIANRFSMFAPYSAAWTGGNQALAELTELNSKLTFPALNRIADYSNKHRIKKLEILDELSLNENEKALSEKLLEVLQRKGSDKSTIHNYHLLYGKILSDVADKSINIFEIGLGSNNIDIPSNMGLQNTPGASLRAFRDVFPLANIYGADIDQRILFEEDRIKTFFLDQCDVKSFGPLIDILPACDLIIDDGLHAPGANLNTLEFSLKKLTIGGWFVVEDITEPMLTIWELVSKILPIQFDCKIFKTKTAYVFTTQKIK